MATVLLRILFFIVGLCSTDVHGYRINQRRQQSQPYQSRATTTIHASSSSNNIKTSDILSLESIRSTLVRQEETIIFALIERAQYRRNYAIYDPKEIKLRNAYGAPQSFLEYMLLETEKLQKFDDTHHQKNILFILRFYHNPFYPI